VQYREDRLLEVHPAAGAGWVADAREKTHGCCCTAAGAGGGAQCWLLDVARAGGGAQF